MLCSFLARPWLPSSTPPPTVLTHSFLISQTLNFLPLRGHSHLSLPSSWVLEVTNFSTSCSGSLRPIFWASSSERDSRTLSSGVSFSSNVFCHSSTAVWEEMGQQVSKRLISKKEGMRGCQSAATRAEQRPEATRKTGKPRKLSGEAGC